MGLDGDALGQDLGRQRRLGDTRRRWCDPVERRERRRGDQRRTARRARRGSAPDKAQESPEGPHDLLGVRVGQANGLLSQRPAGLLLGEGQLFPARLDLPLARLGLSRRPCLLELCRRLFFLPLLLASRLRLLARHDHEDVVTHLADQPACPDERIEGIANRHLVEGHGDHARGRGRDDQADAIPLGERAEGGLYVGSAKIDRRPIGRESLSAAFVLRLCRTRREHREEGEGDRGGNPHGHLLVVGAALKPGG